MVKEKPNSTRIYDSEGYRRRAACICVKNDLEDEVGRQRARRYRHIFCRSRDAAITVLMTRKNRRLTPRLTRCGQLAAERFVCGY